MNIRIIKKTSELLKIRSKLNGDKIGLVPTMGNLHDGHLSLIIKSLNANKHTIVTIFVNPKQFGPNEDFESYPRTLNQDCQKIESLLSNCYSDASVIIFAPDSVAEIYPPGFSTQISVSLADNKLCAKNRPTHFAGVATVVYQLFSLCRPQLAYFGQKDYQQLKIIKKMVHDLRINIEIVMLPIRREASGLALSSRNQYLSEEDKSEALILAHTISEISTRLTKNSYISSLPEINAIIEKTFEDNRFEYLEILDAETLFPVESKTLTAVVAGAFKIGKTRLVDNQLVGITYA